VKEEAMTRRKMNVVALLALIVGFAAFFGAMSTRAYAFNCKIVSCAAPMCEDNEHLETPAGQCCPVCVPN
jgi:uncharacterized membrane protein